MRVPRGEEIDLAAPISPAWHRLLACERANAAEFFGSEDFAPRDATRLRRERAVGDSPRFRTDNYVVVTQDNARQPRPRFAELDPESIIATVTAIVPLATNRHKMWGYFWVEPAYRRRGIGTAILDFVRNIARREDRTEIETWASAAASEDEGNDAVLPLTVPGALRVVAGATPFLLARGYGLEAMEKVSGFVGLDDPATRARACAAAAEPHHTADYELLHWSGPPQRATDRRCRHAHRLLPRYSARYRRRSVGDNRGCPA